MTLRALSSGVAGLHANQTALDVIGNNIANLNTPGFKAARPLFADVLSQTIAGPLAPSANSGGRDAMQVGLGVAIAGVHPIFTQGAIQTTENPTDLAIQGDGFFVLAQGDQTFYTRAGSFSLDADGVLVDSVTGFRVQGAAGDITIAPGTTTPASVTTEALFGGNLDAGAADGTTYTLTFSVRDSLGAAHPLTVTFTKNFAGGAPGQWDWAVTSSDAAIDTLTGDTGSIVFDTDGAIASGDTATLDIAFDADSGIGSPQSVDLDWGSVDNAGPMTGFAAASTAALTTQDGFASGALNGFAIASDGSIIGTYDNGRIATIGQVQLATFANPGGLVREGRNLWSESVNSGPANLGNPGTGGHGTLLPGAIEGSNVDLAREFTELITAQRGFEASARIIRVGDELLQTAVNLVQ
jgi:flagellar hook protein FlgE